MWTTIISLIQKYFKKIIKTAISVSSPCLCLYLGIIACVNNWSICLSLLMYEGVIVYLLFIFFQEDPAKTWRMTTKQTLIDVWRYASLVSLMLSYCYFLEIANSIW